MERPTGPIEIGLRHPLYDAARKLDRAREHIEALDAEINAFFDSKPFSFEKELNPEGTHQIYRVKILAVPDQRLTLILGDAIHNLRATLDYLVGQCVLAETPNGDNNRSQFPILRNEADWGKWRVKQMVKGISDYALRMGLREGWKVDWFSEDEGKVLVQVFTIPLADDPENTFEPTLHFEVSFGEVGELVGSERRGIGTPYLWQLHEVIRDHVFPAFVGLGYFVEKNIEPTQGIQEIVIGPADAPPSVRTILPHT